MTNATTPKLVVCDLDHNLLHNRDAEADLLDCWMMWERGKRPLLLFHSARPVEELQHLLPSTVLPPADFLIGGGTGMLVRHSFWSQDDADGLRGEFAGFAPEHLLASMASRALAQLNTPDEATSTFPKVENAVLTMAGLSVTFASNGKKARRSAPHAPLAWLLAQLQLDTSEIRTYTPEARTQRPRLNAAAR